MWFVSCVSVQWKPCVPVVSSQHYTYIPFENKKIMKKNKQNNNTQRKTTKANAEKDTDKDSKDKEVEILDEEEQGFGGWLRSSEGLETMKLFVLANSIVLLTTLAYPNFQIVINIVYDMIYGEDSVF